MCAVTHASTKNNGGLLSWLCPTKESIETSDRPWTSLYAYSSSPIRLACKPANRTIRAITVSEPTITACVHPEADRDKRIPTGKPAGASAAVVHTCTTTPLANLTRNVADQRLRYALGRRGRQRNRRGG